MDKRYCVIMAGGAGNRFWPISRDNTPEQFLDLLGEGKSFLRQTYERFSRILPPENILVVTLDRYSSHVASIIPELPSRNLLLEPFARGTAPCMVYAAASVLSRCPDALMVATPSDLLIRDENQFARTISDAFKYVEENHVLMTLGIVPHSPDPNYGYIQVRGGKNAYSSSKPLPVKTFVEKPNLELAKIFLHSGEFFWNSGIFIWEATTILAEMSRHTPEVVRLFVGWEQNVGTPDERAFIERAYGDCPKVSLDHGVMEKTDRACLFPAKFEWSDVGSWGALYQNIPDKDSSGNAVVAGARYLEDCRGSIVFSRSSGKLMAVKGLHNYIVVDTGDVLMICPKDDDTFRDFLAGTALPGFDLFR
ncbi:MAG: mannose-1-phosphate guanylyltransferase [Bacteroidales bacterium]|nr:mannose-1-phosphate guanylyltransferase [Bacteroidales bacterium]